MAEWERKRDRERESAHAREREKETEETEKTEKEKKVSSAKLFCPRNPPLERKMKYRDLNTDLKEVAAK